MTTKEIGFSDKLKNAVEVANEAKSVVVTNSQEHSYAGVLVDQIRGLEKELESEYKNHPTIIQAREIQKIKSELAEILETGRKTAKGRQMAWEDAEEAKRRAEESRLAAEAKKRADDEALAAAKLAQEQGNDKEAVAVLEAAITAPAPIVVIPKTAPKTINRRTVKKFRIVNAAIIPKEFLKPDEVKIGGVVRSMGLAASIPGVEVWEENA